MKNKEKIIKYFGIVVIIIISLIIYVYEKNSKIIVNDKEIKEESKVNEIAVYITGAVNKEGVYYCKKNVRLNDVIANAGGLKKEADIDKINLARKIIDGDKVVIPYKREDVEEDFTETEETSKKININEASKEKLVEIPGIGDSTADKIIKYREKNKFETIEDLKEVPGIGDSKFEKIKELVYV